MIFWPFGDCIGDDENFFIDDDSVKSLTFSDFRFTLVKVVHGLKKLRIGKGMLKLELNDDFILRPAKLLYLSNTTEISKGVILTHLIFVIIALMAFFEQDKLGERRWMTHVWVVSCRDDTKHKGIPIEVSSEDLCQTTNRFVLMWRSPLRLHEEERRKRVKIAPLREEESLKAAAEVRQLDWLMRGLTSEMKKSGSERKRVRRSPASLQNGTSDTPPRVRLPPPPLSSPPLPVRFE
uniref:Uncharacterized protein n=1 Tax=Kalanchoe fedtschenkoi TaxID=63787 RepID=A0A7N0VLC1_KALFE